MSKTWKDIGRKHRISAVTFSKVASKAMQQGVDPRNSWAGFQQAGNEIARRADQAERRREERRKAKAEATYITGDPVGKIEELLRAVTDQAE